jgi:hypothetical protein
VRHGGHDRARGPADGRYWMRADCPPTCSDTPTGATCTMLLDLAIISNTIRGRRRITPAPSACHCLLRARRQALKTAVQLELQGVTGPNLRVLQVLNLDKFFTLRPS